MLNLITPAALAHIPILFFTDPKLSSAKAARERFNANFDMLPGELQVSIIAQAVTKNEPINLLDFGKEKDLLLRPFMGKWSNIAKAEILKSNTFYLEDAIHPFLSALESRNPRWEDQLDDFYYLTSFPQDRHADRNNPFSRQLSDGAQDIRHLVLRFEIVANGIYHQMDTGIMSRVIAAIPFVFTKLETLHFEVSDFGKVHEFVQYQYIGYSEGVAREREAKLGMLLKAYSDITLERPQRHILPKKTMSVARSTSTSACLRLNFDLKKLDAPDGKDKILTMADLMVWPRLELQCTKTDRAYAS